MVSTSTCSSCSTSSSSSSSSTSAPVPNDDTVLEPSNAKLSTLRCLVGQQLRPAPHSRLFPTAELNFLWQTGTALTRASRHTFNSLARKKLLKGQRGCRRCVGCGFWKQSLGFVRSLAQVGSPSFQLRTFRTCNECSRHRKDMDEEEHLELYGARDVNP
ncbi:hypothetical protein KVR01_012881 [Diaporthe batatas]|uniref:uncharacterized protein n=1 Tax=Diaporthe batatas TaxID=748121 RepID=UPI001D041B36|nr:uncharacterized protein KVR01_012881 [Diaporthe batatas]KAG8157173.1 hypothetical protein KVR01_012881 [Diaporthe batatas]